MKRKSEIESRLAEIRNASQDETDVEKLTALENEATSLQEERSMIEKKMSIAAQTEVKLVNVETNSMTNDLLEKRAKDLRESRTVKVSSEGILVPSHTATQLGEYPFKEFSSIVDRVNLINLNGGETYKKSYVKSHGVAGQTGEGEAYSNTEPEFDYVTISKVKLTCYTEITEELEKLPDIPYQAEVLKNIEISLKKKIASQIILGNGQTNNFTGIFSTQATAIETAKDIEISTSDNTTLDKIIYAYGGDEEVEGDAVLILNKNDLRAFATLRTNEGRKVHQVDYRNQTIDGIPYIINSNCPAISDSATATGSYSIAYGSLKNYEVPVFSPVEIAKSTDDKVKDGIICYKASVFTGGNVTGFNGFLRVKKAAATAED